MIENNVMISKEAYIKYYRDMKRIRMVEDAIAEKYNGPVREMHTPIHLYNGQEAVAVGICSKLQKEDIIFSNHRSHGHYLAKGGNLSKMIAELFSKETGCCRGRGGSMHLMDRKAGVGMSSGIVAGNVSIATGYALGIKLQKKKNIAVVFLGDGASEEGSVYESICFAVLKKLPVLFVCENNLYAISSGWKVREPLETIQDKFSSIIKTVKRDGNDVIEITECAESLIRNIRAGDGPAFMECMTYRLRDHHNVGTGVESGYRSEEEWSLWKEKCPIEKMKQYLKKEYHVNSKEFSKIETEIQKEIDEAFYFAHISKLPDEKKLSNYLWG